MARITTSSGQIDILEIKKEDIFFSDISHALSLLCRFGGHSHSFYCVAEHAVLTAVLLRTQGASPQIQFAGLHHDDQEAYICDMPSPLKRILPEYQLLEDKVEKRIHEAFGINLDTKEKELVKWADKWMCWFEKEEFVPNCPWPDFKKKLGKKPKKLSCFNDVFQHALKFVYGNSEKYWHLLSFSRSSPMTAELAYVSAHGILTEEMENE